MTVLSRADAIRDLDYCGIEPTMSVTYLTHSAPNPAAEYADQRAHDVAWMTAAERADRDAKIEYADYLICAEADIASGKRKQAPMIESVWTVTRQIAVHEPTRTKDDLLPLLTPARCDCHFLAFSIPKPQQIQANTILKRD